MEVIKLKVALAGDGAVGKTSLIRRFVDDTYSEDYISTLGTSYALVNFPILQDTQAGCDHTHRYVLLVRRAHFNISCFDLTNHPPVSSEPSKTEFVSFFILLHLQQCYACLVIFPFLLQVQRLHHLLWHHDIDQLSKR